MKTIVCYGDSNTWGFVPEKQKPIGIFTRYGYDVRWPGVIQSLLGDNYKVIEEGLNGRTTAFDDPLTLHRNGLKYIDCCLSTKMPVDLVIVMLGTNDCKEHIGATSFSISAGLELIVGKIKIGGYGLGGNPPEILLISPANINESITQSWLSEEFGENCIKKDRGLSKRYEEVALRNDCHFIDAAKTAQTSTNDAIHLDAKNHMKLAKVIHKKILEII